MSRVVVAEFMDERAVAVLRERHDVLYDPTLVDAGGKAEAHPASLQ